MHPTDVAMRSTTKIEKQNFVHMRQVISITDTMKA